MREMDFLSRKKDWNGGESDWIVLIERLLFERRFINAFIYRVLRFKVRALK